MTDTPSLEDLDAFSALGGSLTGAELLGQVHAAFTRYVIFPSAEAADAVTLYTAATHAQAAWEHATRLVVEGPIKRCGKTRLQEVARELVHKALPTTNISPAALARSMSQDDPPTLILDEADTIWGKKDQRAEGAEDLRGIINSGHSAAGPTCAGMRPRGGPSSARHSPWPSSAGSATCPTPSRTAPSSSRCGGVHLARRHPVAVPPRRAEAAGIARQSP